MWKAFSGSTKPYHRGVSAGASKIWVSRIFNLQAPRSEDARILCIRPAAAGGAMHVARSSLLFSEGCRSLSQRCVYPIVGFSTPPRLPVGIRRLGCLSLRDYSEIGHQEDTQRALQGICDFSPSVKAPPRSTSDGSPSASHRMWPSCLDPRWET
jgi:hypothetical protein